MKIVSRMQSAIIISIVYSIASLIMIGVVAALSRLAPGEVTSEAWGHVLIAGALAILLPLRVLSVARHNASASRPILIATLIGAANLIEGTLTNLFPLWMRFCMFAIACLMLLLGLVMRGIGD